MPINKSDVIEFFDSHADTWDSELIKSQEIVNRILDNAEVSEGKSVLDIATGTGVLINDYKQRGITDITAVDISPEMVKICRNKYKDITVLCGDADNMEFGRKYDCIMIYNAFPHFPEPEKLLSHLCDYLNDNGTLTVAHGMSRAKIDKHHEGSASRVSVGLMTEDDLEKIFSEYLEVSVKISDESMYQVTGKKITQ